jgi:phosphatidylinositol-3-phosphatase
LGVGAELCDGCGSALDQRQRYCLSCGERAGSRSSLLAELLTTVRRRNEALDRALLDSASGAGRASDTGYTQLDPGRPARTLPPMPALRLPPARVSALLVLIFLGFGVLLGGSSNVNGTLAASAGRLKLMLPQVTAAAGRPSSPAGPAAASAGEPPESEPAATPEPAEAATTSAGKAPTTNAPTTKGSAPASSPGTGGGGGGSAPAGATSKLPPIKHVFVIMLSSQPYAAVFGPASPAHYLSQTLERHGTLLVRYDAVAHEQLADGLAILSGQGPTAETAANCPTYGDIAPATPSGHEQVLGNGCVYPRSTQTLPGQLIARRLPWRAYVQGLAEPGAQTAACGHPSLGAADPTAQATSEGSYATFRNPLVYFHSLIDSPSCVADDVGLDRLAPDLSKHARTPSFSYIVPDRCHDGNPVPCGPGAPAGLAPADGFLAKVVPEITGSKAYRDGGLLVITVDQAPSGGEFGDSSSCCGQPQYPNLPPPAGGLSPRGGGAVGALLLSPFIKGAATSQEPYSHFSLLRTIEDLFGLKHLGYAGLPQVKPFEASIFSR